MLTSAVVCLALLGGPAAEPVAAPKLQLLPAEEWIVAACNRERQRYGLPPLAVDARLMDSARHATWMTVNRTLVHSQVPLAENIAMGQPDAGEAMRSWLASPGHRANILNPHYQRMGAAGYVTSDGTPYWCQQFFE